MKGFLILFFSASVLSSFAQLQNTSWKGMCNLPDPTETVISLTKDTMTLNASDLGIEEIMAFRIKGDTLFIKKVSGPSSCDPSTEASYIINFKENKLFLVPVSDDCEIRRFAFPSDGFVKVET